MRNTLRILTLLLSLITVHGLLMTPAPAADKPAPFELKDGDRVVFLGDTFIEREQYYGWIELMLTTRFPDRNVTFRNLGWSADTPAGDSRFGLSLLQAGKEPPDEGWKMLVKQLEDAKPTVVFVGYGMASSFDGEAGLPKFKADYNRLLDTLEKISPGVRLVLLGPIGLKGAVSKSSDLKAHMNRVGLYIETIRELSSGRRARFVDLSNLQSSVDYFDLEYVIPHLSPNGIHLNEVGYRVAEARIALELFGIPVDQQNKFWSEHAEELSRLRQAIIKKNEWFFHRSRPANMAYIFGFRKREQGNNAVEIPQFDALIAAEEKRIAELRSLKPGVNPPPVRTHVGNLTAKFTPQPHPEFTVGEGLEVSLYAENPLLNKPIQMNFDPQGRLWVASSELYPQIEPGQEKTDKIIVLEDTDRDGRAEKATVFADGLLIPTGVIPGDGGCYVAQSTDLLHFRDTNGDGKSDARRIVLSGFGVEDTHHNLHTLRYGPDGRMYMNQSVYTRTDTETPHGVVRLKAGGIFRFDPRDQMMEILYRGWVNAWGTHWDDYGQVFVTDGAGFKGISWGVPGATYFTLAPARRTLDSISPGNYPKFCGLEVLRSAMFPADWQGDMITCDFRAHRVVRFKAGDQGAGYVTKEMPDLLRTTADTFRPIDVKMGPDGALYIADWSNPIIQHGEVDFRDPRRDKEHGRIWRVAWKGGKASKVENLTQLKTAELLNKLTSPNNYDREQAKRVLIERGAENVAKDLAAWTKKQSGEQAKLEALWMHQALNQREDALLEKLLAAKDAKVRAAAVRVLGEWSTGSSVGQASRLPSRASRPVGIGGETPPRTAGTAAPLQQREALTPALSRGERENASAASLVRKPVAPIQRNAFAASGAFARMSTRDSARGDSARSGSTTDFRLTESARPLPPLPPGEGRGEGERVQQLAAAKGERAGSETGAPNALAQLTKLIVDENPRVRLEAVRALGKLGTAEAAAAALTVLDKPMDDFLDYALWLTINELADPWIAALQSGAWTFEGREKQLEFALKAIEAEKASEVLAQLIAGKNLPRDGSGPWIELIGSAGGPKELRQMFDQLLAGEFVEPASLRVFAALGDAARLRGVKPAGELASFGPMLRTNGEKVRIAALQLAGTWKLAKFTPQMTQAAGNADVSPAVRAAAFAALREIGGPGVMNDLKKLAASAAAPEIRRDAVVALAGINLNAALPDVLATLSATTDDAAAQSLWRALLGIKGAPAKLADALRGSGISAATAKAGLRPAREGNQNPALVQALMQLAGLTVSDRQLASAELQALAAEVLAKGDAARGETIYRRAELGCVSCHAIGGAGGKVGPDMTSIGASAPADYLVESLLHPNAKIKEGYHSVLIATKDELEFSGIIVKETDNEIVLRNAANQEVSVAKNNVGTRRNGASLMPSGLVDALLPEERMDLFKFLTMLGKPGDYDAAKGGAARHWRAYTIVSQNQAIGTEPVVKGDFTLNDWVPVYSRVSGRLTKADLAGTLASGGRNTRGFFVATQFEAAKAGRVTFTVDGGITGAWLNGQRVKPGAKLSLDATAGVNTLVLQMDEGNLPESFRVSSGDVSFLNN